MNDAVAALVQHFEGIYREHMRGLPIVNSNLGVEAVGFRELDGHWLGVLITPWFMNLVLLPGSDEWSGTAQGSSIDYALPAGRYDLTTSHDDVLGTYLTAVLFRTVQDFPDQDTAREVAVTLLNTLFEEPTPTPRTDRSIKMSRRELFARLGAS